MNKMEGNRTKKKSNGMDKTSIFVLFFFKKNNNKNEYQKEIIKLMFYQTCCLSLKRVSSSKVTKKKSRAICKTWLAMDHSNSFDPVTQPPYHNNIYLISNEKS